MKEKRKTKQIDKNNTKMVDLSCVKCCNVSFCSDEIFMAIFNI